jgi:hypothetical protein
MAESFEYGNEYSVSIEADESLDQLRDCQLSKNDSVSVHQIGSYMAYIFHVKYLTTVILIYIYFYV